MNSDVLLPTGKSLTVWRENLRRAYRHSSLYNLTTLVEKPLL